MSMLPTAAVRLTALVFLFCMALSAMSQTTRIRLMAANTSSGNYQSYMDPGNRIFQGLDPDIVMIQEFSIGSSASQDSTATTNWVNANFGPGFNWHREGGNEQIPNGIISRYPILQAGEWTDSYVSNRDHAYARIDIPGDKDLWVVSVHFLTSSSGARNNQATQLRSYIQSMIPAGDYLVIGGDYNTDNRSESCVSTLSSLVVTAGPHPADRNGNTNTNANRNKPYDWLLVNSGLNAHKTPVVIGSSSFANGLVFDSRVYTPLSEVSPIQSGDSGVSGMQHMAVVKDFLIPTSGGGGSGDDFSVAPASVNFGTRDASTGPYDNNSVSLTVSSTFQLNSVSFTGTHASEFALLSPSLAGGPVSVSSNTPLTFRWTPAANDGASRQVTAHFATSGTPGAFSITLNGATQSGSGGGGGGDPINAGGYIVQQIGGAQQLTIPTGTIIPAGKCLVIGRDATLSQFEAIYGPLPSGTVYLRGASITGSNSATVPVINGDEQFRLLNASSVPVDPVSGYHPAAGGMSSGQTYSRNATNGAAFTASAQASASPGVYTGVAAGTGKLVISEFSDAAAFANEFIEIYNDAAAPEPPAPPGGLIATAGNATVTLDWSDSSATGLAGYSVYRATTSGGPYTRLNGTLLASSAYTDNAVANGSVYFYVVTVTASGLESAYSLEVSASPQVPIPAAPLNVEAIAGDASVALSWDPIAGAQYNVYRGTESDGPYTRLNPALLAATSYIDTSALNGTPYFYVVTASVSSQESEYSAEVEAQPFAPALPPAAPSGLIALPGLKRVTLTWAASEPPVEGYSVFRAATSGGPYTLLNPTLLATGSYIDTTVTSGTLYFYAVTATTGSLESARSAEVSASPIWPAPPVPPGNLTATGMVGQIELAWDDSHTTGSEGYKVYRAPAELGPYSQLHPGLVHESQYVDGDVQIGFPYFYRVTEFSDGVESAVGETVTAIARPGSITGLFTQASDGLVQVTWDERLSPHFGGYHVYRGSTAYGPFTRITEALIAVPAYTDTAVVNDTTYYYSVTYVEGGAESFLSNALPATPSRRNGARTGWALYR